MLLAADIGGTKTLLGLFDPLPVRPRALAVRSFVTLDYDELAPMLVEFLNRESVNADAIDAACFGVAGPVIDDTAELTNVPWRVDGHQVAAALQMRRVSLLNDLQAMAYAVPVLQAAELHPLQQGEALKGGNIAIIAAGTGLGEALLHNVDGRFVPSPSEGGHADFPARTEREIDLVRYLTAQYGRADVEHVVSGRGLMNVHRATHRQPCAAAIDLDDVDAPARISAAGLTGACSECADALELFVGAYGAEAGNLALRTVSTGGVFIGGGIAPKILPALTTGVFMHAFLSKPPLEAMLAAMPVNVILNADAGLLGAAVFAAAGK
jgi:glucokinase